MSTTRLPAFIRENTEAILAEWEAFARTLPAAGTMDIAALRDHAKAMLEVIATDLETPQTPQAQELKAHGGSGARRQSDQTAAQEHGTDRAESGFTIEQMVSEFRALRASVMRLWCAQQQAVAATDLADMIRFDEAIDQAIAESVERFSENVSRTQERFLAILGHDLRTPLGAILMSAQFMLDTGELAEPHRSLVVRVGSSATRMNQMVLDLLEFTRTRLGDTIPIVRAPTDLRRLMHDVALESGASYPRSPIQIATSGALSGSWDADRLTQAVTNLVSNAAHHGSPGTPIRLAALGEEDAVCISVHNEGPPIAPDTIATIFQEGMRARSDDASARRHLGLGLYIVDRIVAAHDGTIAVESTADAGTTFTLRLPR